MAYNTYTTDDLVNDILLLGHVPTGNNTFGTSEILRLADMELQTPVTKQILSTRGGYYLTYEDFDTRADGLYVIPTDCIAGVLANIELVQGETIVPVNLIEEQEQFSTNAPTSTSYGAFMRGNYVQILPTPNIGVTRLWYFKRTSKLVATTAACQVTAINGAVITVSSIPSTISVGSFVDALGDQPPFNILGDDLEILDITSTDITLDAAVDTLQLGDWLALHKQTPVPQIPVEYRVLLAQRVVVKIYELQGYLDKMKAAQMKLKEYEDATFSLVSPRIKSQTKIIMSVNGGFLGASGARMTNFPASRT
jgi:hypothetical protein